MRLLLNKGHVSTFLSNTRGAGANRFAASRHKAPSSTANVASGTKARKEAMKFLLALTAPKTRLSHFCLHGLLGAYCRSQVNCNAVIKAGMLPATLKTLPGPTCPL